MKVLYTRVSTIDQNTDRQRVNEKDFSYVVEDKCSGAIPFFKRQGGEEMMKLLDKGIITSLHVHSLDRLGRDLKDILSTIEYFNNRKTPITFITQGITTLDESGKENAIANLMIGILGTVAGMERTFIRERQFEGIRIAKLKGAFHGRKTGSSEDTLKFLSKPKNQKALDYLKKGYSQTDVSKIVNLNINTIGKIKKYGLVKG